MRHAAKLDSSPRLQKKIAHNRQNLTGKRFGRLTVIRLLNSGSKTQKLIWECKCDCGNIKNVYAIYLTQGDTKSCGCYLREFASNLNRTHSQSKTPTYRLWARILNRCRNKNSWDYKFYGGRGIKVCERWLRFENFYEDMGKVPEGLEIDRINNNLGYFKDNCRYTTHLQNCKNSRRNRLITFKGQTKILCDWARQFKMDESVLRRRLNLWKNVEKAFFTPLNATRSKSATLGNFKRYKLL